MYSSNLFWLADGIKANHAHDRLWMADRVGQKICDWRTELQMAVNAWVAFAIKNCQLNYIVNYTNEIF